MGVIKALGANDRSKPPSFDFGKQCAVSNTSGLIYIHVPKVAGSSMHGFVRDAVCDQKKGMYGRECVNTQQFRLMPCRAAFRQYPHLFRFSFVRHPFSRAVSAWLMAEEPAFYKGEKIPFNEWILNPSKMKTRLAPMHWLEQNSFIFTRKAGNCPVVDYLGVVGGEKGRFEKDMEYVLGKLGNERLWRRWRKNGFSRGNASHKVARGEEAKKMIEGELAEKIFAKYERDFKLFGFDRNASGYGKRQKKT